jgi:imidazolonepropionase-like amidohydrolase
MKAFLADKLLTGETVYEKMMLLEENGKIVALESQSVGVPQGASVIHAQTLMPGLMDAHVHLAYTGEPKKGAFRSEAVNASYPRLALRAARHAKETLSWGFTTVRDMNAPGGVVLDLRDAIHAGDVVGSRIKACGLGLSITGGHMDAGGWGDHVKFEQMTKACDSPMDFRKGVREQVKRGADFIKINLCVSSRKTLYRQEMTDPEIAASIDEAHRLERRVAAHTSGGEAIYTAVKMGLNSVEHGHWLDEKTADLMAQKGAFYVPTLLVNERNFDFDRDEMGVTDAAWAWLLRSREDKWRSLEIAKKAGVKIVCGTDAGFMLPHGSMNAKELELLMRGGLSVLEAVQAATVTAAELLETTNVGKLEVGRVADLVVVEGDLLEDIRILQKKENLRVFQNGLEVQA